MKHLFIFIGLFITAILHAQQPEFRAAWVATVENIDWPSKRGLTTDQQKAEFIKIATQHRANGLNALIVQIRPVADAFYPSPYEPWSEYLTGKQGQAPNPYYDPLEFMIAETHKLGMEFHAWINPYRAVFNVSKSVVAPNHITKKNPWWFVTYGTPGAIKKYFDPGIPNVRNYVTEVVTDIVRRYDVDAIHMDDYFYPYRIAGKEFPDSKSYAQYGKGMKKADWRRANCDSIIEQLSKAIHSEKSWVKFGISPFGVWRNKSVDPRGSNTQGGQTNYDDLYADILLWLKKGWIDYVAPQIYWEIGHPKADFETLVKWWSSNTYGRHCYIGIGLYKSGTNTAWRNPQELPNQLNLIRNTPNMHGAIYYSTATFKKHNYGFADSLQQHFYKVKVAVPEMQWLGKRP